MSYRNPRPKRPSTATPGSAEHIDAALKASGLHTASKKRKFDTRNPHALAQDDENDGERDLFLELDEGAVGKEKGRRRNEVELEGYDSDSSEEGFDATRKGWGKEKAEGGEGKGKGKAKADDGDGDDDMFGGGGGGEDEIDDAAKKLQGADTGKKKSVKFMQLSDIEGQEFTSRREFVDIIDEDRGKASATSGSSSEMDSEADLDPEVGAGGKKKHAPKLDAFNMKSEMDEGRFDANGNFVRNAAEAAAVHDSWLQGVSRKDMKRAREAMEAREKDAREKMRADDAVLTSEVLARLIRNLDRGEAILEALARLGGGRKKTENKNKNRWRQKKKAAVAGTEAEDKDKGKFKQPEDPAETRRKAAVEEITGAADILLTRGQLEIYDETRESLMRQYLRETGEEWTAPPAAEEDTREMLDSKQWEYRWSDGDDVVHGPYGNAEMRSWNEHGFFGKGVEFREKGGVEGWTRAPRFG